MKTYSHKQILCEGDKKIDVFDNIFSLNFRESAYEFVMYSKYQIGWSDSINQDNRKYDMNIHSVFSEEDVKNLGIMEHANKVPEINNLLHNLKQTQCIVNLSNTSDVNFIHSHREKKVLLYYANVEWKDGFHGETQFYNESLDGVQFTSPFVPGRLIVFDGSIPHTIRPQSPYGPKFRFTIAITFN
jgi:hypothetical protein